MSNDDSGFQARAETTITLIAERLEDQLDDADIDVEDGVLTIELDDGGTFVLNRHAPLQQLWLSSPVSGAWHFAYDGAAEAWASTRGEERLEAVLSADLRKSSGQPVELD